MITRESQHVRAFARRSRASPLRDVLVSVYCAGARRGEGGGVVSRSYGSGMQLMEHILET